MQAKRAHCLPQKHGVMRKLKGVSVLNTVKALGIVPGENDEAMDTEGVLAL
jgi:hypothetical protein